MFAGQLSIRSLEAESFRQKLRDVCLFRASRALKKYSRIWPELVDHLPARATGRASNPVIIRHGDGFDFNFRAEFRNCRKNSKS